MPQLLDKLSLVGSEIDSGQFAETNFPYLIGQNSALDIARIREKFPRIRVLTVEEFDRISDRFEPETNTQVFFPRINRAIVIVGPEQFLASPEGPKYYQLPNAKEAWEFCHLLSQSSYNLEADFRSEPWLLTARKLIGIALQTGVSPFSVMKAVTNVFTSRISRAFEKSAKKLSQEIQKIEQANNQIFALDQGKARPHLTDVVESDEAIEAFTDTLRSISAGLQASKLLTQADKRWIHHAFTGEARYAEPGRNRIFWSIPERLKTASRQLPENPDEATKELARIHEVMRKAVIRLSEVLGIEATESFQILRLRQAANSNDLLSAA